MESDTVVYECWLQDDRESFVRLHTIEQVIAWVDLKLLLGLQLHQQLVIVPHLKSEYSE